MWKAQAGVKVANPQVQDDDDDWETEADFVVSVLFVLILYVPSTIFQFNRDGSSKVEPVLS